MKCHWVIGEIGLVGSGITIRVGRFLVLTPLGAWLGITIRVGRFLVLTPLGAWLGLGTQPYYIFLGDPQVKMVETQRFTLGE